MPSTYSSRLRLTLQATGENLNTWGALNNSGVVSTIDEAIGGRAAVALSGVTVFLSSANGATDQARRPFLDVSGTTGVIQIPSVEKLYLVRNGGSGTATISTGGATNAVVQPGSAVWVATDGMNVWSLPSTDFGGSEGTNFGSPNNANSAATKAYVDAQAFATVSGNFPGQAGSANKYLRTDGTNVSWGDPLPTNGTVGQVLKTNGTPRTGAFWSFAGLNGRQTKTAAYTVQASDRESVISVTTSATLTFPAASSVDNKFSLYTQNAGTGDLTLAPTGTDTLDTLGGYVSYPNEMRVWFSDGVSAWTSIVLAEFDMAFTASRSFVYPPGYTAYEGEGSGGAGGGAGGVNSANPSGLYPVAGGGGAGVTPFRFATSAITVGATTTVVIGAAGTGGAINGLGASGGNSQFGPVIFLGAGGGNGQSSGTASGVNGTVLASQTNAVGFEGSYTSGNGGGTAVYGGGFGGMSSGSSSPYPTSNGGGKSYYAGAGGGGGRLSGATYINGNPDTAGTSVFWGNGGQGAQSAAINATAGSAPGGGGGGGWSASSGATAGAAGARGEVRARGRK